MATPDDEIRADLRELRDLGHDIEKLMMAMQRRHEPAARRLANHGYEAAGLLAEALHACRVAADDRTLAGIRGLYAGLMADVRLEGRFNDGTGN